MDKDKIIERKLKYFDNLRRKLKAHETKAALISLRRQWLDTQTKSNYTNERNRIQGLLNQAVLKGMSKEGLEKRSKEFKKLGAIGIDSIV
jgi:hypothetical protein